MTDKPSQSLVETATLFGPWCEKFRFVYLPCFTLYSSSDEFKRFSQGGISVAPGGGGDCTFRPLKTENLGLTAPGGGRCPPGTPIEFNTDYNSNN